MADLSNNTTTPNRKVIRGDSDPFTLTFNNVHKNSMGIKVKTPADISTWDIKFTVRAEAPSTAVKDNTGALISKTAIISTELTGVALFDITPEDTDIDEGTYYYDIQINKNGVIRSLSKAKYIVTSDITRGTT